MIDETFTPQCKLCGDVYDSKRLALGYAVCCECGDEIAHKLNTKRTIAPLHKSNYILVTNLDDLKGLNNKGGIVK